MKTPQRAGLAPVFVLVAFGVTLQGSNAEAQRRCPRGYVFDRFGRCVPRMRPPVVCPAGFVVDRFGRCAPVVVRPAPGVCPRGYYFFRGRCVHR